MPTVGGSPQGGKVSTPWGHRSASARFWPSVLKVLVDAVLHFPFRICSLLFWPWAPGTMLFRWLLLGVPVTSCCVWHWELLSRLTVILNEVCKKDLVFLRNPVDVLVLDVPPPATSCLSKQSQTLFDMVFSV